MPAAAAAQELVRQGARYMTRQPMMTPQNPGPSSASRRNRNKRRRQRQRTNNSNNNNNNRSVRQLSNMMSNVNLGSSIVRIRDTETVSIAKFVAPSAQSIKIAIYMRPCDSTLPRLRRISDIYRQFKFHAVTIKIRSLIGAASTGNCVVGVCAELASNSTNIKTIGDLYKLNPHVIVAPGRTAMLKIDSRINALKWYNVQDSAADGVAFTIYHAATDENQFVMDISYDISLRYPNPF